ncbi:MAG: hypothetical protein Q9192_003680 [Flavoplaca navasiana]
MAFKKQGFSKIKNSCDLALRDGYDYVWVDTCCINKESSAELSEAINSMFRWYKRAAICYAYLSDVDINNVNETSVEHQFQQSQWFTRGWTLQELLAPDDVVFCDCNWLPLGTKQTLSKIIRKRTRIHEQALHGKPLATYSIAQRMSWASHRITTRPEDIAYCLLGIFDVNMPMLYGEGTKAFLRLEGEIIGQSDEHSIFAWLIDDREQTGLLAESPNAFASCQNVEVSALRAGHSSYTMTNRGLACDFVATPYIVDTYLVRLDCFNKLGITSYPNQHLGMFFRRLDHDDQYSRVRFDKKTFRQNHSLSWVHRPQLETPEKSMLITDRIQVNVRQRILETETRVHKTRFNGFRVRFDEDTFRSISEKTPILVDGGHWDSVEMTIEFMSFSYNLLGTLDLRRLKGNIAYLRIGFDFFYNPVCVVLAKCTSANERDLRTRDRGSQYQDYIESTDNPMNKMAFDDDGWSRSNAGCSIVDVDGHPGCWALKGDRLTGFGAHRLLKRNSLGKDGASIAIEREETETSMIWVVYLPHNNHNKGRNAVIYNGKNP